MAACQPHLGSSIDISDLDDVLRLLTACGFCKTNWHELGLRLGLLMSTLNEIQMAYPNDVSRWLTECLDKWLRRADNVDSRGGATWNSLSNALKSINEKAVANKLQCHLILTIFESHHDALSESLSDPINVAWLLHGERMIKREVVNGVESASPSIPKQRQVLLAAIKEVIQTEPSHLQRFATALSKFATTRNLSLGKAIQVDIDKYFPPPEVGITSNTDEPPPSTPLIPSPSISPFPSTSPPSISPPSIPPPSISPPIASLSVLPASSVLSPSQMSITSSDAEVTTNASSKPAPQVHLRVPIKHRDNFNSIRISYGRMFYQVKKIFKENSPSLEDIKELLSFCSDLRQKVDSCTNIFSILRLIQDECSLTDVELLACVVEELKITEAEELIINYKKELKEFCCSVRVDLCLEEQFDSIHHLQCELAIFELDWEPKEHMLQHIKDVLSKVSELLGIKRIKLSNSISVVCSFPLSLVGFVVKMVVKNFHILIHHGLKKLTIGNVIIWRRQDVREKELREKKPDALQDTEFISFVVLQKTEHGLNEAIDSKEKEIVELKQELHASRHLNEEESMLMSAQSDAKLMKDVEENSESMREELVVLRSHCSEYKKINDRLADNFRKMKIEYPQSLSLSSHKNTAASKMRYAMECELNNLKFCLEAMNGPDYRPLVENKKEKERLQEEFSLVDTQLITERQNKEMIMKKIKETGEKINEKKLLIDEKVLKKALDEAEPITYYVSTAIVQGETRVGKTSLKSLILSLPYDEVSTSCIEAPRIAYYGNFSVDRYAGTDGKGWKLVTDGEMDDKIIAELQDRVRAVANNEEILNITPATVNKPITKTEAQYPQELPQEISSPTLSQKEITASSHAENESIQSDQPSTDTHQPEHTKTETENNETEKMETENMETDLVQKFDALEFSKRISKEPGFYRDREWLYFIDSGGQIQFQKLLLAFMPCTTSLILVVNLSKKLSDPPSTSMQLSDETIDTDKCTLSVEDVLKQVLSAVASNARKLQLQIKDIPGITIPQKKLNVISVGTHRDELEKAVNHDFKKVEENIEETKDKLQTLLSSLGDICDFKSDGYNLRFYDINGAKAKEELSTPLLSKIKEISESLRGGGAYKINVPLRWHYFGVILRKEAIKSEGVLKKSSCEVYGKSLDMSAEDVDNALKFFHTLKMIFYYHESPAKDIVFVKLDSLIDIIRDLMIHVCKFRNNKRALRKERELLYNSFLTQKTLESFDSYKKVADICGNKLEKKFSEKLLGLFEHLDIAVELENENFLMPALLPVSDLQQLPSTVPLVFYFKTAVPMGLYCAVIVHLSIRVPENEWRITSECGNFSNYFNLQRDRGAGLNSTVVLVEKLKYIEVYCDDKDERLNVTNDIERAISEVMKKKKIDYEMPQQGFYCPCGEKDKHTAKPNKKGCIICEKSGGNQITEDTCEEYWSWYMNKQEIETMLKARKSTHSNEQNCETNEEVLNENDLADIIEALDEGGFVSSDWYTLGLQLRIKINDLKTIENDYHNKAIRCLNECLIKWLKTGKATYTGLAEALKKMGEGAAADHITKQKK